jgi:putative membrane protein
MKRISICLLSAALSLSASAQTNPDLKFVREAAMGGMMEVTLGRMAQTQGSSQQVKDLGTMMVNDHSKANDELLALAKSKNITVPTTLDKNMQAQVDRLSRLSGKAFDNAYANLMVKDHRKDIAEFQKEARMGKDADIKSWAAGKIATLQSHLSHAEMLQVNKGTGTRTKTKSTSTRSKTKTHH